MRRKHQRGSPIAAMTLHDRVERSRDGVSRVRRYPRARRHFAFGRRGINVNEPSSSATGSTDPRFELVRVRSIVRYYDDRRASAIPIRDRHQP